MHRDLAHALRIAAANSSYARWPLGCVITKGGALQAVGWNTRKNNPQNVDNYRTCSVHAEAHALRQMRNTAPGCTMHIARILKNGAPALARPCHHCQQLITRSGIRRVTYTINAHLTGTWNPRTNQWTTTPHT